MKYSIRHEQIGSRHKTVRRGYIRISEYSDSGIFLSKCNKLLVLNCLIAQTFLLLCSSIKLSVKSTLFCPCFR